MREGPRDGLAHFAFGNTGTQRGRSVGHADAMFQGRYSNAFGHRFENKVFVALRIASGVFFPVSQHARIVAETEPGKVIGGADINRRVRPIAWHERAGEKPVLALDEDV